MTTHALSTAVASMEIEHEILCKFADSVFARGACIVREVRMIQGILHRHGTETLTPNTIAKRIVTAYRDKVKPAKNPDGPEKDGSFTQATRNVEKLLKAGFNYARLLYAVENYARAKVNAEWIHRFNAGNFFGRREEFKAYLPEGDVVVPDADKAAKVETLFDGREE